MHASKVNTLQDLAYLKGRIIAVFFGCGGVDVVASSCDMLLCWAGRFFATSFLLILFFNLILLQELGL